MIKQATYKELPDMAALAAKFVSENMPFFSGDSRRTLDMLKQFISDRSARVLVSVENGEVRGGALAYTQQNPYAQKQHTQIVGIGSTVQGDTSAMVEDLIDWWIGRRASLLLCYAAPINSPLDDLLLKYEFVHQGTMLVRFRYDGFSKKDC